jgi:adenylosuccinate lyase
MKRNLEKSGGTIYSEGVLLALVEKGLARDAAYRIVQRHALKAGRNGGDLKQALANDPDVRRYLSPDEIEQLWDVKQHLGRIDLIFDRVFD